MNTKVIYDELSPREPLPHTPSHAVRQVLIPGTRKAMPHQWVSILQEAKGYDPEETESFAAGQIQRGVNRAQYKQGNARRRAGRYGSTGRQPHRNPARLERLRKSGRLRRELR